MRPGSVREAAHLWKKRGALDAVLRAHLLDIQHRDAQVAIVGERDLHRFGVVRDEFPKHKVPTGIALLGAIAAIGSSIGLPLGGVLTDGPGYHSIFAVAAIMGLLATATTLLFVPKSPIRTPGPTTASG